MSTPASAVAASRSSPNGSAPTAATSATGEPSLARFSATFRPTPPGVVRTVPGLLVRATAPALLRALTSWLAPPMTRMRSVTARG